MWPSFAKVRSPTHIHIMMPGREYQHFDCGNLIEVGQGGKQFWPRSWAPKSQPEPRNIHCADLNLTGQPSTYGEADRKILTFLTRQPITLESIVSIFYLQPAPRLHLIKTYRFPAFIAVHDNLAFTLSPWNFHFPIDTLTFPQASPSRPTGWSLPPAAPTSPSCSRTRLSTGSWSWSSMAPGTRTCRSFCSSCTVVSPTSTRTGSKVSSAPQKCCRYETYFPPTPASSRVSGISKLEKAISSPGAPRGGYPQPCAKLI